MTRTSNRQQNENTRPLAWLTTAGALALTMAVTATPAAAAFENAYAPANWSLTNTDADGSVDTSGAPASIALTGGDDGSGLEGSTAFTTTATGNGTVSFSWLYSTIDDEAEFDPFGFVLNGLFTELTDPLVADQSGFFSFGVQGGDAFGFQINTVDNFFGAATALISDFSFIAAQAPGGGNGVPEPGALGLLGLGLVGLGLMRRRA